jgi:hypothetical protein
MHASTGCIFYYYITGYLDQLQGEHLASVVELQDIASLHMCEETEIPTPGRYHPEALRRIA